MSGAAPADPLPIRLAGLARVELRDPLFISDLHLNAAAPATLARFLHFCDQEAAAHAELLILGDLFEYWVGDDTLEAEDDAVSRTVAAALRSLTARGVRVFVMHGNADKPLVVGLRVLVEFVELGADGVHGEVDV